MWRTKRKANRRRAPRRPVRWIGHYRVAGPPEGSWSPCAVRNISEGGSGMMLQGGMPVQEGEALVIEIERIGPTPVSLRIRGTARSVGAPTAEGDLEIGVQLVLNEPHQQHIAKTLFAGSSSH
jgi:PilZ domain